MDAFAWAPHVLSIELRKVFTYRATFWIHTILGTVTELTIAYFLWGAIFAARGAQAMSGFSFHGILFYYVFGALSSRMIRAAGDGTMAQEIYDGTLTRYLLYPLSFVGYKYVSLIAQQLVAFGQLLLGFLLAVALWGLPSDQAITAGSVLQGAFTAMLAGWVLFLIGACLEFVAFWQDTVWNLMAMLRFIGSLLGGLMIPLAFFPSWGRTLVRFTPFPVLYNFPIRCFLGQVGWSEWLESAAQLLGWGAFFALVASWIWSRGTRRYTGVGI